MTPYGLMFGRANYWSPPNAGAGAIANWRLDRIKQLEGWGRAPFRPPTSTSRPSPGGRSASIRTRSRTWCCGAARRRGRGRAAGASTQPADRDPADGWVLVRFRASGMLELAWHLFAWGDKVEIVQPARLKTVMAGELAAAQRALERAQA